MGMKVLSQLAISYVKGPNPLFKVREESDAEPERLKLGSLSLNRIEPFANCVKTLGTMPSE